MFGFLKKKIDDFASKISKKAEEKIEESPEPIQPKPTAPAKPVAETQKQEGKTEKPTAEITVPASEKAKPKKKERQPRPPAQPEAVPPKQRARPSAQKATPRPSEKQEPPKEKPRLSLATRLKQAVSSGVSLSEKEIDDFTWEFELALLEADVAQPVAEEIISSLKESLSQKKFSRGCDVQSEIESVVRGTLSEIISLPGFDLAERAKKSEKPFVIMFLGPNGAGKTTTLAKVAHMLKKNKLSSVFAASDTFRAASIEQLQHHADALGMKMVKHTYGADPAAVAFDAIKSAKARGIDCVLIDTAGRQETNKNLMQELKKIKRVANPDALVYLDEALAGNALLERVEQFKSEIGVDGVILSKMDMDVKGGGVISIARSTGVPIIYYGTGQSYEDLERFSADGVLDRIFG